ncbi:hypothetical protein [Polynucleobacter campilacus]|uniref:Uncharacterized protein n=1 Tax=Polynucleobacter campilacus TaxID=1743163 RepID=A0A254PQZ9_9BURK|nr:hypothetical protein [Polynucleobacter campilacus]OWS68970.1 hypothetical protein CBI31_09665 [Polynucleobacter campilacus]
MAQLLSLLNHVFSNQTKGNNLEQSLPSKGLQAVKTIKDAFIDLYDAWIEARLQQAKYYNKHHHIE